MGTDEPQVDESPQHEGDTSQVDKALQKEQMRRANLEKKVEQELGEIKQALQAQPQKSENDQRRASQQVDDVDQLAAELEQKDTVDGATLSKVVRGLTGSQDKKVQELGEQLQSTVQQELQPVKEQTKESATERFWREWEKEHPQVADRKDELLQAAYSEVEDNLGPIDDTDDGVMRAVELKFNEKVKEAEKSAQKEKPKKEPKETPSGVDVTPGHGPPSSAGYSDKSGPPPDPGRIFVPDE